MAPLGGSMITRADIDAHRVSQKTKQDGAVDDDQKHLIIRDAYRVRILPVSSLPIIGDSSFHTHSGGDVIVIDAKHSNKKPQSDSDPSVVSDMDTSNGGGEDDGGEPLTFKFLLLDNLDSASYGYREERVSSPAAGAVGASSFFDANPIPDREAFSLRDSLIHTPLPLEPSLLSLPVWLVARGGNVMGSTLLGWHKTAKAITSMNTVHLGRCTDAVEARVQRMDARFSPALTKTAVARAVYELLEAPSSRASRSAGITPARVSLTFTWRQPHPEPPLTAPPANATCVFRFSPGWKDPQVSLNDRTLQLEFILMLAETLRGVGAVRWQKDEKTASLVSSRIEQLIEECGRLDGKPPKSGESRFVDFTEHLFSILIDCSSGDHLVLSFRAVFDALREGRINTILHEDNRSLLARLVRDSSTGQLMLPRLEALTPIQLLLEIGLEKFQRDTVQHIVVEDLVSAPSEVMWPNGASPLAEERAFGLLPVHLALQTMLEVKKHIRLSTTAVLSMMRQVMCMYCSGLPSSISSLVYETEVTKVDILPNVLNESRPHLWTSEATYRHGGADVKAHTLLHLERTTKLEQVEERVISSDSVIVGDSGAEPDAKRVCDPRSTYLASLTTTMITKVEGTWIAGK